MIELGAPPKRSKYSLVRLGGREKLTGEDDLYSDDFGFEKKIRCQDESMSHALGADWSLFWASSYH